MNKISYCLGRRLYGNEVEYLTIDLDGEIVRTESYFKAIKMTQKKHAKNFKEHIVRIIPAFNDFQVSRGRLYA